MAHDFEQSSTQYLASIDAEIKRLQQLRQQVVLAVSMQPAAARNAKPVRRSMSAQGRRRIAEAQKARWAKQKGAAKTAAKGAGRKTAGKKSKTRQVSAKTKTAPAA